MKLFDQHIINALKNIQDETAPEGFVESVMGELKPYKPTVVQRFWRMVNRPLDVSVTPLRAAAGAVCLIVLTVVALRAPLRTTHAGGNVASVAPSGAESELRSGKSTAYGKYPSAAGSAYGSIEQAHIHAQENDVLPPVPVVFSLPDPDRSISDVAVIGTFNNWNASGFAMRYDDQTASWMLSAELPPGEYEYVFLVDGNQPMPDPNARFFREDSFGSRNALLRVLEGQYAI